MFAGGLTSIAAVVTADRIGKGVRTAPRDAMISASSDPAHLGRAFGVHRTLDTVGAALGPLIAFGVLWLVPDGFDVVMVVSLAFAVLGVAVLAAAGARRASPPGRRPGRDAGGRACRPTSPPSRACRPSRSGGRAPSPRGWCGSWSSGAVWPW